jgi:hypothetical protein
MRSPADPPEAGPPERERAMSRITIGSRRPSPSAIELRDELLSPIRDYKAALRSIRERSEIKEEYEQVLRIVAEILTRRDLLSKPLSDIDLSKSATEQGVSSITIELLRDIERAKNMAEQAVIKKSANFTDSEMRDYVGWAGILGMDAENVRKRLDYNKNKAGKGEISERNIMDDRSKVLYSGSFVRRVYFANTKEARPETIKKAIDLKKGRPKDDTANISALLKLAERRNK